MIPLILVLLAVVFCVCAQLVRERYLREIRREERIAKWDQMIGRMHRPGQAERVRVTIPRDAWHRFEGYHRTEPRTYITTRVRPCVIPACHNTTATSSGICLMHHWSPERVRDTGTE